MEEFIVIYVIYYALGLLPFIAIALVLMFIPATRLVKAFLVSAAAISTATPVVIPIGWGIVIAPISLAVFLSPTAIDLMLLSAAVNWPLQACSALASAVTGLLIGYYLLPRSRFNRSRAAPDNLFNSAPHHGDA